ncbi:adenine deaminase C-terminal domain-containing protein [Cryobacterium sp. BB736]|uniref:adenine deaminase C-terminal domain-containing protein n=1 Tax=Cryobacterium sp. BB736 TaxID=2746963 RepID=UPI001873BA03|nr:adenine deaminase C-terminal domain-containing protein [Cryobacterium sp. BB736]
MIDTHLHLVGCQLNLPELSRLLVSRGTAAVSACFYEAGMIGGRAAIDWMLGQAADCDLRVFLSPFIACQRGLGPFGNLERISSEEFLGLIDHPACVEIREWNVHLERLGDPTATAMIERARRENKVIAGHLEGMTGAELQASVTVGVSSDHEAVSAEEALERVALGVKVQIREGSGARDFDRVIEAITVHGADPRFFMFCTDGQEVQHTARGHIDSMVRRAIEAGVSPIDAIRIASLNAAEYLRVDGDLGSITPGRTAHINIVDDLNDFRVSDVFVGAVQVVTAGRPAKRHDSLPAPEAFTQTIHIHRPLSAGDFKVTAPQAGSHADLRVIDVQPGVLVTRESVVTMATAGGDVSADPQRDIAKMAVIDRHQASGRIGLGFARGFGIRRGAIASTNSPALMNLMTLGVNDYDMAIAANRAAELGGGLVAVLDGLVLAEVGLPLFGVLTERPAEEVVDAMARFERIVRDELGSDCEGIVTLSGFVMMPVSIPGLKLCDRGLVRVEREHVEAVPLFVESAR